MWLNRPKAKICFKSDSNQLLIDFFAPKSSPDSIEIVATIQIWTHIWNPNLIYINFYQKLVNFVIFVIVFNINRLLQSFNRLLQSFNRLLQSFNRLFQSFNRTFGSLYWSFNRNRSNKIDSISKLRSSTQFRRWILNRTEINDRIQISDSIRRRQFDSQPLIALA